MMVRSPYISAPPKKGGPLGRQAPAFWQKKGLMAWALLPLACVYGLGAFAHQVWRRLWAVQPAVPVVSVGNLTAGGAGKTPLVAWLAQQAAEAGTRVAILSRGYGGQLAHAAQQVGAAHTAEQVGDEPLMLFQQLEPQGEHVAIWVGKNRKILAEKAVAAGAELLILDDGFQYTSLLRQLNILVVGEEGFGNGFPLPAGPLRECVCAASRADFVVHYGAKPTQVGGVGNKPSGAIHLASQPPVNTPLFLFAGLGNPTKFFNAVQEAGAQVAGQQALPDHMPYTAADWAAIQAEAKALGATPATTHKDAVKIAPFLKNAEDLVVVKAELSGPGLEILATKLAALTN